MNIIDCIKNRRSVRTFDEVPLSSEEASKLLAFASDADNPYGLKIDWRLLSTKESDLSTTVIVGADDFIAGKMKKAPHAEEAFGYSFERIVLFAESIGLPSKKPLSSARTRSCPAFLRSVMKRKGCPSAKQSCARR